MFVKLITGESVLREGASALIIFLPLLLFLLLPLLPSLA